MTTLLAKYVDSPVGTLTLVGSDAGLRAVLWPDDDPARVKLDECGAGDGHPVLERAAEQLTEYFAGARTEFDLPLDLHGTDFQVEVWRSLARIPYGETASYGEQAGAIGRPVATTPTPVGDARGSSDPEWRHPSGPSAAIGAFAGLHERYPHVL